MKEVEEIKLARMEEETNKARRTTEALKTFEGLSRRIKSGKTLYDIPPPPPSPSPIGKEKENKKDKDKDKGRTAQFVQKYSNSRTLAESIIVAGVPYFAVARINGDETVNITLEDSIPVNDTIEYRPFQNEAYLNKPYSFKSREEFDLTIEKAKGERHDSLYKKVKSIWKKYVDADDFHISICAADTFFTYWQDKIGMAHYLFFVGNNNCGKSK
jgi:hypothetical protein